jgi:hypothetical protein
MLGVVLAAGDATRMPNKLMLVAPDYNALIINSIKYCLRHCDLVDVVIKDGESALEHYLLMCYPDYRRLRIRRQAAATGVVDAISLASSNEDLLVAFGDCYGYQNLPLPGTNQATCISRQVGGLDGFKCVPGTWVTRDLTKDFSFSGAFRVDTWQPKSKSLMNVFNDHNIAPILCDGVQDCGTPGGYLKTWQQ